MTTLYWHDYETTGTDPARDRPMQFAGVRTDENLEIVGEPLRLLCRPDLDLLPHPAACLLTGITPQQAARDGVAEPEFAARILAELGKPGTCGVGYNSLRFDDEFTRFLLYRNFFDPYEREWRHGNSRWDIIDMLRLARALRPEGIAWPDRDGVPSFRLEDLAAANGIAHDSAHDALSDVLATIGLARRVRERQPDLYRYVYENRQRHRIAPLLDPARGRPVLHVSGRLPRERGYTALVLPLARHPANANAVICFDLMGDADALIALDAEAIRARLFTPAAELPADVERLPLKAIHSNRCPVVATPKLLDVAAARRLGIDLDRCTANGHKLRALDLSAKLAQVFAPPAEAPAARDADAALYAGFLPDEERSLLSAVRTARGADLDPARLAFRDARYRELLFRYRARHFPETLTPHEREHWRQFCRWRLTDPASGYLGLKAFRTELAQAPADPARRTVLAELHDWGARVAARHGNGAG